jgi:UDP-2,3-diacylglucosamine pyrophosphatase LpxH
LKLKLIYRQLDSVHAESMRLPLHPGDRYVIFSDLHIGDGSAKDDFRRNAGLFGQIIEKYYLSGDYRLVLNGDIEELQRFSYRKIRAAWPGVYDLLARFSEQSRLFKTVGNHDLLFALPHGPKPDFPVQPGLVLESEVGEIFIFHGHQASLKYHKLNSFVGYALKYLANPLRIKNYSVAHNSRKKYKIEKRVYQYSAFRRLVSVIGHTHRPLFESMSKAERLRYKIEEMCRQAARGLQVADLKSVVKTIKSHKKELRKIYRKNPGAAMDAHLYGSLLNIPCLFNSGTAIGKRGITCIEIRDGEIALVHWFDEHLSHKYLDRRGYEPMAVAGTGLYRMVLNAEHLDYIFTRIRLLT